MEAPSNSFGVSPQNPQTNRYRTNEYKSLCVGLFLATLEISIVSTALVNITDGLRMFGQGNWIVTAYLLTYTGIVSLKLSA